MKIQNSLLLISALWIGIEASTTKTLPQLGSNQKPVESKTLQDFRFHIADLADKVKPTVVSIKTESTQNSNQMMDPFEELFGQGFGFQFAPRQKPQPRKQEGLGSGVIVSKDGYILTNNHVVAGAQKITVTLLDERTFEATIVGRDEATDLAVIKIKKEVSDLPVAYLADSDELRVGEWIVAIGNPFGLNHTVTTGIVSAKDVNGQGINSYESFIQVDAAINPGNSGGALLNLDGGVVGINSAILSRSGGFQGIGFAIPMNMAKSVMRDLIENGKVTRGWLGVSLQDVKPELAKSMKIKGDGVLVSEVLKDSPAEKSGLKLADVIIKFNGKNYKTVNSLRNAVSLIKPNSDVEVVVIREGKELKLNVKIGALGGDLASQGNGTAVDGPQFGAEIADLTPVLRNQMNLEKEVKGVLIKEVVDGGIAEKSGLKQGDLVLQVNNAVVENVSQFKKAIQSNLDEKSGFLVILREKAKFFIPLQFD